MNHKHKYRISVMKYDIKYIPITCYVPTLLDEIECLLDLSLVHTIFVDEKEDTKQFIKY